MSIIHIVPQSNIYDFAENAIGINSEGGLESNIKKVIKFAIAKECDEICITSKFAKELGDVFILELGKKLYGESNGDIPTLTLI